jgi:hypothetical protein
MANNDFVVKHGLYVTEVANVASDLNVTGISRLSSNVIVGNSTVNTLVEFNKFTQQNGGASINLDVSNTASPFISVSNSSGSSLNITPGFLGIAGNVVSLNSNGLTGLTVNALSTVSVGNVVSNTTTIRVGNSTVAVTVNSTIFSGTANNALTVGGFTPAQLTGNSATAYTNAVAYVTAQSFVNTAQLAANLASIANTTQVTSNAATAYANAVTYTDSRSFVNTAQLSGNLALYSNSSQVASSITTSYNNAVAYVTAQSFVNTAQLASNLALYSTASQVVANASTTYANAVAFVNSRSFVNTSQLSGNLALYSNTTQVVANAATAYSNAVAFVNSRSFVTSDNLFDNLARYTVSSQMTSNIATAYTNAVAYVDGKSFVNTAQLAANIATVSNTQNITANAATAYTNAVNYVDSKSFVNTAQLASNLALYSTTSQMLNNTAAAYTNAVAYVDGRSFVNTAQLAANISSFGNTLNITANAATAYTNAVAYVTAQSFVNTSQLSGNLALYSTVSQMLNNTAAAYTNAVSYVDGKSFVNTAQLSNNLSSYSTASQVVSNAVAAYTNAVAYVDSRSFVNTAQLSSNLTAYATTTQMLNNTAAAFTNAVAFVNSRSFVNTAQLSGNIATFANTTQVTANAVTAYTNAVNYVDGKSFVNTAQLSSNLALYSTTAQMLNNVTISSTAAYTNAVAYVDGKSFVNTAQLAANIASSSLSATVNNALNLNGQAPSFYVSNSYLSTVLSGYVNDAELSGNLAVVYANSIVYVNSKSFVNSSQLAANLASISNTEYVIGEITEAYTNAVAYVDGKSFVNTSQLASNLSLYSTTTQMLNNVTVGYTNAVAFVNSRSFVNTTQLAANIATFANTTQVTANAATAYTNAVNYVDNKLFVNTSQLSGNLALYSTTTQMLNNVTVGYTNAVAFVNSRSFVNTTQLSGNLALYSNTAQVTANINTTYTNAVAYVDNKLFVNTSQLAGNLSLYSTTTQMLNNVTVGYTNAVSYVTAQSFVNTAQLSSNLALYSNTTQVVANAAAAYTNAVSFVNSRSFVNTAQLSSNLELYSNTVQVIANAATSYTNAVAFVNSRSFVNTSQLSGNLALYSNTVQVVSNATAAYTNAVAYVDGKSFANTSQVTSNAATAYTNAVSFVTARSFVNTSQLAANLANISGNVSISGILTTNIISSSTSANTSRSLNDIAGEVYNVKFYGAVGDGIVDDRAAIQAAIDAAYNSGIASTVYIPPGKYKIGKTSNTAGVANTVATNGLITYPSIKIQGEQNSTTLQAGNNDVTVIGYRNLGVYQLPTVVSATVVSTTGTVTFGSAHGLSNGDTVRFIDFNVSNWNAKFTVTVTSPTTITVTVPGGTASASSTMGIAWYVAAGADNHSKANFYISDINFSSAVDGANNFYTNCTAVALVGDVTHSIATPIGLSESRLAIINLRNIYITGSVTYRYGVYMRYCAGTTLDNIKVQKAYTGFYVDQCGDTDFSNCEVFNGFQWAPPILSATRSGASVPQTGTINYATPHGFRVGDQIKLLNFTTTTWNQEADVANNKFIITSVTATSITFNIAVGSDTALVAPVVGSGYAYSIDNVAYKIIGGPYAYDEGVRMVNTNSNGQAIGLWVIGQEWGTAASCSWSTCWGGAAIFQVKDSTYPTANWRFVACDFSSANQQYTKSGVLIDPSCYNILFSTCFFALNKYGAAIFGRDCSVTGSYFLANLDADVLLSGSKSIVISDNNLASTGATYSIVETGDADGNVITGNKYWADAGAPSKNTVWRNNSSLLGEDASSKILKLGASPTGIMSTGFGPRNFYADSSGVSIAANAIKLDPITLGGFTVTDVFDVGDAVYYRSFAELGNTPVGGLANNGTYYVSFANASHIALSETFGGANVDITSVPSGSQTHWIYPAEDNVLNIDGYRNANLGRFSQLQIEGQTGSVLVGTTSTTRWLTASRLEAKSNTGDAHTTTAAFWNNNPATGGAALALRITANTLSGYQEPFLRYYSTASAIVGSVGYSNTLTKTLDYYSSDNLRIWANNNIELIAVGSNLSISSANTITVTSNTIILNSTASVLVGANTSDRWLATSKFEAKSSVSTPYVTAASFWNNNPATGGSAIALRITANTAGGYQEPFIRYFSANGVPSGSVGYSNTTTNILDYYSHNNLRIWANNEIKLISVANGIVLTPFDGIVNLSAASGKLHINGTQVLTTRQSAITNALTGGSATAADAASKINLILDTLRAHGLIGS